LRGKCPGWSFEKLQRKRQLPVLPMDSPIERRSILRWYQLLAVVVGLRRRAVSRKLGVILRRQCGAHDIVRRRR
jgi:hypothetical protein